jgi:hypothetical protein
MGDLREDARAIAGIRLGARGAPVLKVAQDAESAGYDIMPAPGRKIRYESHTAGVMFELTVVQTVGCGRHHQNSCRLIPL